MVFPPRNLPGDAEKWGRAIEEALGNIDKTARIASQMSDNTTRAVDGVISSGSDTKLELNYEIQRNEETRAELEAAKELIDQTRQDLDDATDGFTGRMDDFDEALDVAQGEIEQAKTDLGLIEVDLAPGGGTYDRITDALLQAGDAQDAADNAQGTATAAQTAASNAQDTADQAVTAAGNAQTVASNAATAASTAQDAADQAAQDAATAAGIAASKGDVLIQETAPATAMRKATTLWIDTTGGTNTPKRWNGSAWVAVTDKAAVDAAAAAATAQSTANAAQDAADQAASAAADAQDTADQAVLDAAAAQAAAGNAQDTADAAQTAAAGKSAIYYSTEAPSGTGTRQGDVWFRRDSQGSTIGMWEWTGASWQSRTLRNEVIANLDAGKITTGYLAADRLNARSITADKVLVTAGNLFPDPYFQDEAAWIGTATSVVDDENFTGGKALEVVGAATQRGSYYRTGSTGLQPGTTYRVRGRVTVSGAPGRLLMYFRTSTGTSFTSTNITLVNVADGVGTHDVDVTWEIPNNAVGAGTLGIFTGLPYDPNSVFRVGGISVQPMASGHLIVDGSVTAEKVAARSITAEKLVLGSSENLIPNGNGEFGDFGGWASFTSMTGLTWETADAPAGVAGYLRSTWAGAKTTAADAIEVDPNGEYLFEVWIRADKPDSRLYLDARAGTSNTRVGITRAVPGYESGSSSGAGNPPAGYLIQNKPVPTTWTRVVGAFTPNGVSSIRFGGLITNHTTSTVQDAVVDIGGLRLIRRASAELIVDGAITADKVAARSITANKLVLGSTSNLIPNGLREFGTLENVDARFTIASGPAEIPGAFLFPTGTQAWHEFAYQSPAPVQPGQKYHLETWLYSDLAGQSIAVRTDWLDASGTYLSGTYYVWPTNLAVGWTKFEQEITPPANAVAVRWTIAPNHQNGTVQNARPGIAMRLREKASLIVDGAIKARHVVANEVAAAVGVFIDAMMENLTVTGVANLKVAVADALYAKLAVVEKLQATNGIITNDMIATGAVTATKVTASEELTAKIAQFLTVYAEDINVGRDARWWSGGLVFYAPPAQGQDPTDWENRTPLIALTPTGDLSITVAQDGEPTAGMTAEGEVWAHIVSADQFIVAGDPLDVILQRGPRGLLGVATSSNFISVNTAVSPYLSLNFTPEAGRMYEIEFAVRGGAQTSQNERLQQSIRQARPGQSATHGTYSRELGSWENYISQPASMNYSFRNAVIVSGDELLSSSNYRNAGNVVTIWTTLSTRNGNVGVNSGGNANRAMPPHLTIKDIGEARPISVQTVSAVTPPPPAETWYGPVTIKSSGSWGVRPNGSNAIDPRLTLGGYNIYGTDMAEWILYQFNFSRLNGSTVRAATVQLTVTQNAPVAFTCYAGTGPTTGHVALFTATANSNGTISRELSAAARQELVGKTCLVLKPFYPGNTASYGYFSATANVPVIYSK